MKQLNKKLSFIITTIFLIFVILIIRLFYLTVVKYNKSFDKAVFYDPIYKRVDIVDKNNVVVASNIKVKTLYLNKDLIENAI